MAKNEIVKTEMAIDNDLALAPQPELTPGKWGMIRSIAEAAYRARMFRGASSPEAAAIVMLKGFELGIGLTASFEFIQPIQGKFELIPRGALALMHQSPEIEDIKINRVERDGTFYGFECYIKRTNGFEYTASFSMEDAERAGLVKPDSGYTKYPENMCMWRAVGFAADVAAPDITSGMTAIMKTPEHYGVEIDQEGNVIDVEAQEVQEIKALPETVTVKSLIDTYGPEAVMAAIQETGGQMPSTADEIQKVAETISDRTP